MIDEVEDLSVRGAGDTAAVGIAMAATPSAAQEARDYLRRQSRIADMQIENLQKVDKYETSHLRWRRFNEQMKGAMQIMVVLFGAAIVIGIAAALWNASQSEGLVVDSFAVPPAYAQAGVSGSVMADDMTEKIAAISPTTIRSPTQTTSANPGRTSRSKYRKRVFPSPRRGVI
ncbi:MAG TPA: hypothetical protein VGL35_08340 [Rhizomicrobium sp.]|jgi:hypothetical protein